MMLPVVKQKWSNKLAKISVIIPVYNTEKYLPKCLDSIINQTLKDIEIICVNDCSTDNSLAILQKYANKDKRIKLIDLPKNIGAGEAKNEGLKIAQGLYLGFVDPDDYIDLNFYEELYKNAYNSNADIVKGKLLIIDFNGVKVNSNLNECIKNISKFYFTFEYTSAIYKSELIKKNNITFSPDLLVGEDVVFQNNAVIKAKSVEIIDNVKYYYVKRKNSLNTEKYDTKRINSAIKTIRKIAQNYNNALNKELDNFTYVNCYLANMLSLFDFTITKTEDINLKQACVKEFLYLYSECLLKFELENIISKKYTRAYKFIKNKNAEKLMEILDKYKNLINYCYINSLRKNIKKGN